MDLNTVPQNSAADAMAEQTILLTGPDGCDYFGRFTGAEIGQDVYLLKNGDVLVYFEDCGHFRVVDPTAPDLSDELPEWAYFPICDLLGVLPVLDLDLTR